MLILFSSLENAVTSVEVEKSIGGSIRVQVTCGAKTFELSRATGVDDDNFRIELVRQHLP